MIHEIFIRRSWYSVLPSLDATISGRFKKAVASVIQLITALVSIHSSMTEYSKSALTEHANQANRTIDWKKTTVIDREQDRPTRWIKEAVHIRKESRRAMNRDEGSYQLSHAYDRFVDATADRRINTQKN